MKKSGSGIFLSVILAAVLCVAAAEPVRAASNRFYLAGYMGLNTFTSRNFSETTTRTSGSMELDNATSFAGALGLRLDDRWRVEGELSYRASDLTSMTLSNGNPYRMGGEVKSWVALANAYYDFDLGWKKVQPFLGFGFGLSQHNGNINDSSGFAPDVLDDTSYGFAWQLGGGLRYNVHDNLSFSGGYRYLGTTDIAFDDYDIEYGGHEFRVGIEYDFPVPHSSR